MEQTASYSSSDLSTPAPKRRKLRKGTSSCWECKRRKARCTFFTVDGVTDDVCSGCKHRGTRCISQDLPDQPAPDGSNRHLVNRLAQVESLVGRLVQTSHQNVQSDISTDNHDGVLSFARPQPTSSPWLYQNEVTSCPLDCNFLLSPNQSEGADFSNITPETQNHAHTTTPSAAKTISSIKSKVADAGRSTASPGKYHFICQELLATWPLPQDMDIILSVPVHTSTIIRGVSLTQPVSLPDMELPSPETLLELPPPESHPTLIARKLLLLATFLQGIPPKSLGHLENLTISRREIMSDAVAKAHALVTCNDELVASIEGIECLMLEGLYESYSGNLRPSWLASRRAVTIAQMLRLDRGIKPPSLLCATFKPDHVWFRLVQLDRYLSMMLGLPHMLIDETFVEPDLLESCTPEERMHRLNCAASGRLLQLTPAELVDLKKTKEIDKLLEQASASLPPQWWLTPTLSSYDGQMDTIRDTVRFNGHFMHYHMLLHLHLPYLLLSESSCDHEYSRMAAITASREILIRIASFRTIRPTGYYCRGLDLLAFLACTALGLAHICDHDRRRTEGRGLFFLSHQRLSDRGLLEHTLQYMSDMARVNDDSIGSMVSALLEHLLAIEEDAADGSSYTVTSCPESGSEENHQGGSNLKLSADGSALTIHLPHIWDVRIERGLGQNRRLPVRTSYSKNLTSPSGSPSSVIRTQEVRHDSEIQSFSTSPIWQNPSLPQLTPFAGHGSLTKTPLVADIGNYQFQMPIQELNGDEGAVDDIGISIFDNFIQEMSV